MLYVPPLRTAPWPISSSHQIHSLLGFLTRKWWIWLPRRLITRLGRSQLSWDSALKDKRGRPRLLVRGRRRKPVPGSRGRLANSLQANVRLGVEVRHPLEGVFLARPKGEANPQEVDGLRVQRLPKNLGSSLRIFRESGSAGAWPISIVFGPGMHGLTEL